MVSLVRRNCPRDAGCGPRGMCAVPNDPSSATRPTRAFDCNLDAMAGFAAAHCWAAFHLHSLAKHMMNMATD